MNPRTCGESFALSSDRQSSSIIDSCTALESIKWKTSTLCVELTSRGETSTTELAYHHVAVAPATYLPLPACLPLHKSAADKKSIAFKSISRHTNI